MASFSKQLKIKLEVPANTIEYYLLLDRWENEGGAVLSDSEKTPDIDLPLQPGDSFRVVNGNLHFEGGEFYYIVDIQKIGLHAPG